MSLAELKSLFDSRKWFDCAEKIKSHIAENHTQADELDEITRLLAPVLHRMHPISSSETVIALACLLDRDRAIELLNVAATAISRQIGDEENYANELISVQMHLCSYKIQNGELEERESEILGWLKIYSKERTNDSSVPFSPTNYMFVQYVAYLYYNAIRHFEQAQTHLYNYLSVHKDAGLLDALVRLSIVSKSYFDFFAISLLEGFDGLENRRLVEVFVSFQNGDTSSVRENEKTILEIVTETVGVDFVPDYMPSVLEKVFLINILNICFVSEQKFVPFNTFLSELNFTDVSYLIALLLKALSFGLISGSLDSQKEVLYFDRLISRSLSSDDLSKMRDKFVVWRDRVSKTIQQMESQ